jgi:hypothetical protein
MSKTSQHDGHTARCPKLARRFLTPSFQAAQDSANSVEIRPFRRLARRQNNKRSDFPLKRHKTNRNSFVINKSSQNPRRFLSIFIDFCARNGRFWPQNPPKTAPKRGAFIPVSYGSTGWCFPTLRQGSGRQILVRLRSIPRSSLRPGFRLPSSVAADSGRSE